MCQSSHSHHESPVGPQSPDWLERLFHIIEPITLISALFAGALFLAHVLGAPIRIDPEYEWVLKVYLGLIAAGYAVIFYALISRMIRGNWSRLKRAVNWLTLEREIRATTIRLATIQDELESVLKSYAVDSSFDGERAREMTREITHLREYRDALRDELEKLTAELKAAGVLGDEEGQP